MQSLNQMTNTENYLSKKAGLPPGTLIHIGKKKSDQQRITVFDYDHEQLTEFECKSVEDVYPFKDKKSVTWINVDGLHDTDSIARLGEHFNIHPLVLEDILNTKMRPQVEEHDDFLFISLKMLGVSEDQKNIVSEQISFILGENWLISFQERQGDIFDGLRHRAKDTKRPLRRRGNDYLLYRLLDTIVDHYYFIVEHINEKIEEIDKKVLVDPTDEFIFDVQKLKTKVINFRRVITPVRDILATVRKDENEFFEESTLIYLNDVYDHVIQLQETVESQKESLTSLLELHTSLLGHKMNQIMKVLTIMASIFIPLTFVAGIYGMNFEYMPELSFRYGYFVIWGVMISIFIGMMIFFQRKKWL